MSATAEAEAPSVVETSMDELRSIIERLKEFEGISEKERETLARVIESYGWLTETIRDKDASIARLRQLLFGSKTESKKNVSRRSGGSSQTRPKAQDEEDKARGQPAEPESKPKPKGHGRNGADAYEGAEAVKVPHESLRAGEPCPTPFCSGTLYRQEPVVLVRICACSPFAAKRYEQDRLRCGLCGKVFKAKLPEEVGGDSKFDESVTSMLAVLRYGHGMPMNRIEDLQASFRVPFPTSTQWDLLEAAAEVLQPALAELIRQAAQGSVVMNDDTPMKILRYLVEERKRKERGEKPSERTGIYTSGIVSEIEGKRRIVLYFTGKKHAGENLKRVLEQRGAGLDPPIQMCDALGHNTPPELRTILSHCLTHARRQFVDVATSFPPEVHHVIDEFALVYRHDAEAKSMTDEKRLLHHQAHSKPVMDRLKHWMEMQLAEKRVEPNSGLGKAIGYCLKRWETLTLFLRQAGAPLDNSMTERMLKRAIRHRRNSLFYKTQNGAEVGDLYMSLIGTAKLADENPFEYLNELQRHPDEVAADPSAWMPWNFRETLARLASAR